MNRKLRSNNRNYSLFSDLFPFFPIFAYFGEIFSHGFSYGMLGYRVKRFAEKPFLFDIIVVFNYIVVQVDNLNI